MGDTELTTIRFAIHPTFTRVLESAPRPGTLIAIDVPIGLADDRPREADLAARRFLPRQRKSSVFAAPCRATLEATSYAEAGALNRQARGTGVSIELYNILPKIREVDSAMTPTLQEWVREVHPEVVFAALAGSQAAELPRKKERNGLLARLDLLAHQSTTDLTLQRITEERRILARQVGSAGIAPDDLVDALAGLVAARRIATGQAIVLPPGAPQRDARGLRMEIIG